MSCVLEETYSPKKFTFLETKKAIIRSYLWLSMLLFLTVTPVSVYLYIDAGEHLSPYSISVRGYYRSNGTYVSGHNRRKPGSVAKDKPYENRRLLMIILIGSSTVFLVGSTFYFLEDISGLRETGDYSRYNSYVKEVYSNNVETALKFADSRLSFKFEEYANKPNSLINRLISRYESSKSYSCRLCKQKIGYDEFHTSNLARRAPKKTCLKCMNKHPQRYENSLEYIANFETRLTKYEGLITDLLIKENIDLTIDPYIIKKHFCQHVRTLRLNS